MTLLRPGGVPAGRTPAPRVSRADRKIPLLRRCASEGGFAVQAADAAGVNVYKMRYLGVVLSGILAGMGGLIYVIPITSEYSSTVAGYGFLALAVLIFGNWTPWRIALSAIFFAFAKTLAVTYASIPFLLNSGVPGVVFKIFPYVATLILLAFTSKNSAAPKAAGEPFDKAKR